MKKVILLTIVSLSITTMTYGGYTGGAWMHDWHDIYAARNPYSVLDFTQYINKTGDFELFAELRGSGRATTILYGNGGSVVSSVNIQPFGNPVNQWKYYRREVTNVYASKYHCYATFMEPGVTVPASYCAAACRVLGQGLH